LKITYQYFKARTSTPRAQSFDYWAIFIYIILLLNVNYQTMDPHMFSHTGFQMPYNNLQLWFVIFWVAIGKKVWGMTYLVGFHRTLHWLKIHYLHCLLPSLVLHMVHQILHKCTKIVHSVLCDWILENLFKFQIISTMYNTIILWLCGITDDSSAWVHYAFKFTY